MVAGCMAVLALALFEAGVIVRRAFLSPAGIGVSDLLRLALAVGVALGAWAVGLVALAMGAVAP
ncbi:hypothetical protein [Mesorhizobium sp. KR2-14]|uniref:hypothetical protein n=1 Tax=Mesorhizobium sp. KR2-14 TaxID=3156610 RepID=UPI0032B3A405